MEDSFWGLPPGQGESPSKALGLWDVPFLEGTGKCRLFLLLRHPDVCACELVEGSDSLHSPKHPRKMSFAIFILGLLLETRHLIYIVVVNSFFFWKGHCIN